MLSIYSDPYWNIAEGIKQLVLEQYQIESKDDLIKKESSFINDMSETILFHELGHGTVQHHILPFEFGAIGEASKIYGENIYTAILEFLADFSPDKNKNKGAYPKYYLYQQNRSKPCQENVFNVHVRYVVL